MKRILYVYDGKMTGVGIDAVVDLQLDALCQAGYTVDLVSRGRSSIHSVVNFTRHHTLANLVSWLPRPLYYGAQRRVITSFARRLLAKNDYHLVIAWPQRALSVFKAAQGRIPCLLNCDTLHFAARRGKNRTSHWPEIRPPEMEAEYHDASLVLAPSEYSRETFLERGLPPDRVAVLGRGIDAVSFCPSISPDPARPFRLVFCGRVTERKGIRQVIAAWRLAALPDAELLVIGEIAEDAQSLLDECKGESIRFHGFTRDLVPLLQSCDVQILLSRTEGMAKSLLEGAACGLATLATRESGFPLAEGINGYNVERKNKDAVAEKLRYLHANRAICQQMGREGRTTILANFTREKFQERFLAFVKNYLAV